MELFLQFFLGRTELGYRRLHTREQAYVASFSGVLFRGRLVTKALLDRSELSINWQYGF